MGTFQDSVNYPSGLKTRFIISEDFNDDNIPDLAAANRDAGTISIFIGVGDGTFNPAQYIFTPANFNPRQITSEDFDNDNILDIVAVHDEPETVAEPQPRAAYFKGIGNGTFNSGVEITLQTTQALFNESVSVASGDFNLDNNPDVVVGIDGTVPSGGYFNILFGNGDGDISRSNNF